MRQVVVVNSGQRILIVEQAEIRRKTQRRCSLITRLRPHLLVVIEAGAEISAAGRRALGFAGNREPLTGAERNTADGNVASELPAVGAGGSRSVSRWVTSKNRSVCCWL